MIVGLRKERTGRCWYKVLTIVLGLGVGSCGSGESGKKGLFGWTDSFDGSSASSSTGKQTKTPTTFVEAVAAIENAERDKTAVDPAVCALLYGHITPRVHSIGLSKILTFEPPAADAAIDSDVGLEIPIEGRDLNYPGCMNFQVKVTGTINAESGEDVYVSRQGVGGGAYTVVFHNRYLKKLRTGDHLDVFVTVTASPKFQPDTNCRTVTYAHRRFTVYTVSDYRSLVQSGLVPWKDIQAFPLPQDETNILFGPVVAENFFAVRLSVRNTTGEDKLISTGMISASGRVLVEPEEISDCEGIAPPAFTIPVEIAPQSLEQIYAMVDDQETNYGRSIFFRTLEFTGAVAAAVTGAYSDSNDLLTGVGLFTGVLIPELNRLWPDRWPGYERNVVNFSMPDLFKVPKGAVAGHKYIFFSKKKLEGIISDQNFFGLTDKGELKSPFVAVAQVRFDSLDIPFENVFAVAAVSFERQAANLKVDLPRVIDRIERIDRDWGVNDGSFLFGRLTKAQLGESTTLLDTALDTVSGLSREDFDTFKGTAISNTDALVKSVTTAIEAIDTAITKSETNSLAISDVTSIKNLLNEWVKDDGGEIAAAIDSIDALAKLNDEVYKPQLELLKNRSQSLGERLTALSELKPALDMAESARQFSGASAASVLKTLKQQAALLDAVAKGSLEQVEQTEFFGDKMAEQIRILQATANSLQRASISEKLINNPSHGLTALRDYQRDLEQMFTDISAGRDITGQREKVAAIEAELAAARNKLTFYTSAAEVFKGGKDGTVMKMFVDLEATLSDSEERDRLIGNLDSRAIQPILLNHEGLAIVPELTPKPAAAGS